MLEHKTYSENELKWLKLSGRIDSVTSSQLEKLIQEMTAEGNRIIVLCFEDVNYISSAGLRVVFKYQRQLGSVGGEIILHKLSPYIFDIFKSSGFSNFFRIISDKMELIPPPEVKESDIETKSIEIGGIKFDYIKNSVPKYILKVFGAHKKTDHSLFTENDVVSVSPSDIEYGIGLSAIGNDYEDYKRFFGESIVLRRSLFYYPAQKKAGVDFMLYSTENPTMKYQFFHGFGFEGKYQAIASFECRQSFSKLSDILENSASFIDSNFYGIVLFAELKGLWGMNLKQVPISENAPQSGSIFDGEHFVEWFNFPVEPSDINNVLIASGIACKDKSALPAEISELFPVESNFHIHGAVFEKSLLSRNLTEFDEQIKRITQNNDCVKVQHLMGKTLFSAGMLGLVPLEV